MPIKMVMDAGVADPPPAIAGDDEMIWLKVFCDRCDGRIVGQGNAATAIDPAGRPFGRIYFTHKACWRAFVDERRSQDGPQGQLEWGTMEIATFIAGLHRNVIDDDAPEGS